MIEKINKNYKGLYNHTVKGIEGNVCNRCLNDDRTLFGYTPGGIYCRRCKMDINSNTTIYRIDTPNIKNNRSDFNLDFTLSKEQSNASIFSKNIIENKHKEAYIWAVCGSGKTEIMYESIKYALNNNMKVGYFIPRKDIVIDIKTRLKSDFINTTISAMYSGSNDLPYADIVVSTMNQLVNYYKEFDYIIIDEVDAFPYNKSDLLKSYVQKASKDECIRIYLSATPSNEDICRINRGKILSYIIPARFHGNILNIPKLVYCGKWRLSLNKSRPIKILEKYIKKFHNNFLIYVPTINDGNSLCEYLTSKEYNTKFINSKTLDNTMTIEKFREKKYDFLITTTVLERGFTIKDLNVIVLGSCDSVFNKETLIQICGRVGRHKDSPSGDIIFLYNEIKSSITNCIKEIMYTNQLARKRGLIL